MARLHHRALVAVLPTLSRDHRVCYVITAAEKLFVESMTAYEVTHRGVQQTITALRASEARYRELFENANDIVFTADLDGNFTSINRAGERISGYDRSEVLSMKFSSVVPPDSVPIALTAREKKLSGEQEGTRYELDLLTKDGRRVPLEVNTRLIRENGTPIGVQGIARDITERRQAAQALHRLNVRLEAEARRIAQALHDQAGQLLTSVYLAIGELAKELPGETRPKLRKITSLLDHVVEQLRHLSHELRPIFLDDFGLVRALEFLAEGLSKRLPLHIDIDAALSGRLPAPMETVLYRILQEALTNVAKHADASHVLVTLRQDGETVQCSIADDGVGWDPCETSSYRAKPCLGLIGIRERIAALGGTMALNTKRGQGTTLSLTVPLAPCSGDPVHEIGEGCGN
jgi:PAS domain S-box-containing protein